MCPAYDHVGLATPDLDRAIAFYRDVMGFEFLSRRSLGDDREQATFQLGECILVIFYGPGLYQEKVKQPRSGIHHLAFVLEPDEYEGVLERMKSHGVPVMFQSVNRGAYGIGLATYFYDLDGNDIEIKRYENVPEDFEDFFAEGYRL